MMRRLIAEQSIAVFQHPFPCDAARGGLEVGILTMTVDAGVTTD